MLRYSREVKRWGPGTKAGAPVGVVYCLRTSSFFMTMPAPEFRRVGRRRPCSRIPVLHPRPGSGQITAALRPVPPYEPLLAGSDRAKVMNQVFLVSIAARASAIL